MNYYDAAQQSAEKAAAQASTGRVAAGIPNTGAHVGAGIKKVYVATPAGGGFTLGRVALEDMQGDDWTPATGAVLAILPDGSVLRRPI